MTPVKSQALTPFFFVAAAPVVAAVAVAGAAVAVRPTAERAIGAVTRAVSTFLLRMVSLVRPFRRRGGR